MQKYCKCIHAKTVYKENRQGNILAVDLNQLSFFLSVFFCRNSKFHYDHNRKGDSKLSSRMINSILNQTLMMLTILANMLKTGSVNYR